MASLTNLDAILKDDYKDYWEQLNQACFILAQVKNTSEKVEGRRATHVIHTGRSGAVGARRDGVALPTSGRQTYKTVQVPLRWNFGRIELSQQLISQATGSPGSFLDAMESEMNGIRNDSMRDVCRQVWGTSNGKMATCGVTTASATVTLATTTTDAQMRHLYVNRVVDIGTVANPVSIATTRTITAVDTVNKTITISGATVTTTAAAFIFNALSGGASDATGNVDDGQSELTGLQTIVAATGSLHTVDPATAAYSVWAAQSYTNSGTNRALAESMVTQAILQNTVASGRTIDKLISNVGVGISAQQILSAYQRNADVLEARGGFKGIKWSTPGVGGSASNTELGWFIDFDAPNNSVYGLNTIDGLLCHQVSEGWQWMQEDGAILSRVSGYAAYEGSLFTNMELACVQRNSNFVIGDLTESIL